MKKLFVIMISIFLLSTNVVKAETTTTNTLPITSAIPITTTTTNRSIPYITLDDLKPYSEKLASNKEVISINIGNIFFYKPSGDNANVINFIIAEKNSITDNTYKSLLSIVEALFDESYIQYFQINYKEVAEDKDFLGFGIKINPARYPWEDNLLKVDDYQFIRVNVDRNGASEGKKKMIVVKQDWKTTLKEIFTDQEKLSSTKVLGIPLMDILIVILIILLLIYIAVAFYISNFHKILYGTRSIMAFLPILNIYIFGKVVLNRILGIILVLVLGVIGYLKYANIIPNIKILLISLGGYAGALFIMYIYSVFKYDRVRSESGEIVLKKLKQNKQPTPTPVEENNNTPIVLSEEINNIPQQNNDVNNNM